MQVWPLLVLAINNMDVLIPERFDRDTIPDLITQLELSRDLDKVTVNFSRLRYSYPTAMLVAGSKLRDWVNYRRTCGYESWTSAIDPAVSVHSYLMHVGFFDFIYLPVGNRVGEARGSSRYLPITRIARPDVDVRDAGVQNWYDAIQEMARRLGGVLAGSYDDSEKLRTYTYSIREIIRNVFEHSEANECFICGQRWYGGMVEIAIVDEGVGISRTLRNAHRVDFDDEALRLAIRPGISRTNRLDDGQNIYDNSGFGLYVLSHLAANFGWFALGSGSARLIGFRNDRIVEPSSFRGTFFGMRLLSTPRDFRSVLSDIIESGEEEAQAAGIRTRASGRSRLANL